jgi:hypothetical protein
VPPVPNAIPIDTQHTIIFSWLYFLPGWNNQETSTDAERLEINFQLSSPHSVPLQRLRISILFRCCQLEYLTDFNMYSLFPGIRNMPLLFRVIPNFTDRKGVNLEIFCTTPLPENVSAVQPLYHTCRAEYDTTSNHLLFINSPAFQ